MRATASRQQLVQESRERHQVFVAREKIDNADISSVSIDLHASIRSHTPTFNLSYGASKAVFTAQHGSLARPGNIEVNTPFTGLVRVRPVDMFTMTPGLVRLGQKIQAAIDEHREVLKDLAKNPTSLAEHAIDDRVLKSTSRKRDLSEITFKVASPTQKYPDSTAEVTMTREVGRRQEISYSMKISSTNQHTLHPINIRQFGSELAKAFKTADTKAESYAKSLKKSRR